MKIEWQKKISQEFSRTESCILGALLRLDDFLLNPPIQGHSGTTLETTRRTLGRKPGKQWGQLPVRTSSWSNHLSESENTKYWPRQWVWRIQCQTTVFNVYKHITSLIKDLCITFTFSSSGFYRYLWLCMSLASFRWVSTTMILKTSVITRGGKLLFHLGYSLRINLTTVAKLFSKSD